jgi:hypothetical protein
MHRQLFCQYFAHTKYFRSENNSFTLDGVINSVGEERKGEKSIYPQNDLYQKGFSRVLKVPFERKSQGTVCYILLFRYILSAG